MGKRATAKERGMTDIRCALLDGDRTTTGGVLIGTDNSTHHGTRMAVRGDFATCPACKAGGLVFNDCDPSFTLMGKDILVEGARVHCNCPTKPRVLASQNTFTIQVNRGGSHALMQPLFGRSDNGAQSSNESDEVIEQYFELVDAKTGRPEEGYRHDLFCDGRRVNQDASFGGRSAVVGGRVAMSIVLWLDKSRGVSHDGSPEGVSPHF